MKNKTLQAVLLAVWFAAVLGWYAISVLVPKLQGKI